MDRRRWERRWLVGGGEERGGAEKQVETSSRRRRPTTTTTLISGCEACPRRPTTLLPPTQRCPSLPITGLVSIELPNAAPSSRGGVSTCRAISIIITLIKVSRRPDTGLSHQGDQNPPIIGIKLERSSMRFPSLESSWFSDGNENQ